jgi:hypothetical protein
MTVCGKEGKPKSRLSLLPAHFRNSLSVLLAALRDGCKIAAEVTELCL